MKPKDKFVVLVIFLFVSLVIAVFSGYSGLNLASIEAIVSSNHWLAALFYSLLFLILAIFSFSVSVMTSLGSFLFPLYETCIYSMIGIMGSFIVDFGISRKLGRDYVRSYLEKRGGRIEKFDRIVEKNTFKTILILSAIFFVPPTIPNFLGGIIKIDLKNYSIATFLGNLPNTFFTIYLIRGLLYSNNFAIYFSIIGLTMTTLVALYFYEGEIKEILKLSLPWIFKTITMNQEKQKK